MDPSLAPESPPSALLDAEARPAEAAPVEPAAPVEARALVDGGPPVEASALVDAAAPAAEASGLVEHRAPVVEAAAPDGAPLDQGASPRGDLAAAPPLLLEGELVLSRAVELKQALVALFEQPDPIVVDLSAVTAIDTAGVQLLLATESAAQRRGRDLRVHAPAEPVLRIFALLGACPVTALPPAAAACEGVADER